jgi:hypothetical protein
MERTIEVIQFGGGHAYTRKSLADTDIASHSFEPPGNWVFPEYF